MSRRRKWWRIALISVAIPAVAAVLATLYLTHDPRERFLERHGTLASVERDPVTTDGAYERQDLRLTSTSGLAVDLAIKRPLASELFGAPRLPLLVLLGGHRTGRDAVDLIYDTRGTVVAALSYPYEGNDRAKGWELLAAVPSIRAALLDTPPAILLALDFLTAETYVDPAAIELVGVSLGAPFACIAGALDTRVRRVWSIHGAADPYGLLEYSLAPKISFGPARALVAGLANIIACGPGIAPERWVGEIAPRSFVMVNADADERLPRACIDALFAAAHEPREMIWTAGLHVHPNRKDIVQELVDLVLSRIDEIR